MKKRNQAAKKKSIQKSDKALTDQRYKKTKSGIVILKEIPNEVFLKVKDKNRLASRFKRFLAVLLDILIAYLAILFSLLVAEIFLKFLVTYSEVPIVAEMSKFFISYNDLFISLYGYIILFLNVWLLSTKGQTAGKYFLKIKIVDFETNANAGFWVNVILRNLLAGLVFGFIGIFSKEQTMIHVFLCSSFLTIDSLFIFRKDRRCLHDLIAKTKVIDAV